jgi:hypothetical protein
MRRDQAGGAARNGHEWAILINPRRLQQKSRRDRVCRLTPGRFLDRRSGGKRRCVAVRQWTEGPLVTRPGYARQADGFDHPAGGADPTRHIVRGLPPGGCTVVGSNFFEIGAGLGRPNNGPLTRRHAARAAPR